MIRAPIRLEEVRHLEVEDLYLLEAFEDEGIPFTLHWGKDNDFLDPERLRRMYGAAAVDDWLASRHTLLDAGGRAAFNNDFLDRVGLSIEPPPPA